MTMHRKALAGFLIVCVIWGSTWTVVRVGLNSMPPVLSAGLRFAIASAVLFFFMRWKKIIVPHERKFWKLTAVLCLTAFSIPFGLIYWGQARVDSGVSSVLFATFPFWVALLSHFFLPGDKLNAWRFAGIAAGFCGILMIVQPDVSGSHINIPGTLTILAGAFLQASALIAVRKYGREYNSVVLNLYSMFFSSILLIGWSLLVENYSHIVINSSGIFSILYLALFGTVLSFVIYFWLAKHVEAVVLSLSAFITPVIALFAGVFILNENITMYVYAGSFLVFAGVLIVSSDTVLPFNVQRSKS